MKKYLAILFIFGTINSFSQVDSVRSFHFSAQAFWLFEKDAVLFFEAISNTYDSKVQAKWDRQDFKHVNIEGLGRNLILIVQPATHEISGKSSWMYTASGNINPSKFTRTGPNGERYGIAITVRKRKHSIIHTDQDIKIFSQFIREMINTSQN